MPDFVYPETFIKKAEARIQAILKGQNLDNNQSVVLNVQKQGQESFTARTSYKLDFTVKTYTIKGKAPSDCMTVGESGLQSAVSNHVESIKQDQGFDSLAEELIKSLPNQGFGAHQQLIQLKNHQAKMAQTNPCGSCQGQGQKQCQTCQGRGRSQCQYCNGQQLINCPNCMGQGLVMNGPQGQNVQQTCYQCQGRRQIQCHNCQGLGQIQCGSCQAKGVVSCGVCDAQGFITQISEVACFLKISAQVNLQELDPEPKRVVSLIKPERLMNGGHADLSFIKPPNSDEEEQEERSYFEEEPVVDHSGVYYQVSFPWAKAVFDVNKKPYRLYFAGKKGAVAECEPFLEEVMGSLWGRLYDAARGKGFVAGLLMDASKTRLGKDIIRAVIQYPRKKAAQSIAREYSLGLKNKTIMEAVQNTYLAVKRVTRRPRYAGLVIGLCLAAVIIYGWQNTITIPYLQPMVSDVIGVFPAAFVAFMNVKLAGLFAMKTLTGKLGLRNTTMPAAGKAGFYAILGAMMIGLIFLAFSYGFLL